jgi:hypothetical protein
MYAQNMRERAAQAAEVQAQPQSPQTGQPVTLPASGNVETP